MSSADFVNGLLREPEATLSSAGQHFIQMKSGVHDKGHIIGELANLVFSNDVKLDAKAQSVLYRGLSEAMTNVTRHAYDPDFKQSLPVKRGQWWMAGYRNRENHEIMAFMYDQGVSIPATLPKTHAERLAALKMALGFGNNDGEFIEISMRLGETKSGERQHGKGMADLKRLVELSNEGHLRILSRAGKYLYNHHDGEEYEEHASQQNPINGTFIEWRISDSSLVEWQ